MGKRRELSSTDDEIIVDNCSQKKHKKHRHKKPKKNKEASDDFESDASIDVSFEETIDPKQDFKARIKINKDIVLSESQFQKPCQEIKRIMAGPSTTITPTKGQIKKKRARGKDSGTSSEEERWLDAIESGKLEEVDDELKKFKPKDPKLMTARQRAMYERGTDKECSPGGEVLLALPSGYKEKVMTAEAIQKAAIKSQKRKQLADEKREKDKKKTMERLLKKQESKTGKSGLKGKHIKKLEPMIIYKNNVNEISLTLPTGMEFPLKSATWVEPPKSIKCSINECANMKRYNCSRTGVPLCSLECYKLNMLQIVV